MSARPAGAKAPAWRDAERRPAHAASARALADCRLVVPVRAARNIMLTRPAPVVEEIRRCAAGRLGDYKR